nr:hypothetical transcript [Hymenolepis microstoma]
MNALINSIITISSKLCKQNSPISLKCVVPSCFLSSDNSHLRRQIEKIGASNLSCRSFLALTVQTRISTAKYLHFTSPQYLTGVIRDNNLIPFTCQLCFLKGTRHKNPSFE